VAADGVPIPIRSGGQQWLVSWHPPPEPPDGTPHGAEGVCVTADGDVVVISPDGTIWDLPAGRPEPGESWEQTLRREMDEEACATVVGSGCSASLAVSASPGRNAARCSSGRCGGPRSSSALREIHRALTPGHGDAYTSAASRWRSMPRACS
jgi:hypothetical protein